MNARTLAQGVIADIRSRNSEEEARKLIEELRTTVATSDPHIYGHPEFDPLHAEIKQEMNTWFTWYLKQTEEGDN